MGKGYEWELEENDSNYMSIKKFVNKHRFISEQALRWKIYNKDNPIQEAVLRLGFKILIDEKKFFELLHSGKLALDGKTRKKND